MLDRYGRSTTVGCHNGEVSAKQLGGDLTPGGLMCLPRYTACCRLLIDGMPSKPFSMQTLPPKEPQSQERAEIIRRVSQRRFARQSASEPIPV